MSSERELVDKALDHLSDARFQLSTALREGGEYIERAYSSASNAILQARDCCDRAAALGKARQEPAFKTTFWTIGEDGKAVKTP